MHMIIRAVCNSLLLEETLAIGVKVSQAVNLHA